MRSKLRAPRVSPAEDSTRELRVQAPAKINLRLCIVGRRSDGYHLLDSAVVPISLFDELVIRAARSLCPTVALSSSDRALPADPEANLAVRAARLFMDRTGTSMAVSIQLDKRIPIGSGLGGGSSDAAAVLLALNRLTGSAASDLELAQWAADLGADVPFFVYRRPARLRGVGELIEPLSSFPGGHFVVAFPGVSLSTAEVYMKYDGSLTNREAERSIHPLNLDRIPLSHFLTNDLEAVAVRIIPEIASLKQRLRDLGAVGALMTGSGSAVFGVWDNRGEAATAAQLMNQAGIWARAVEVLTCAPEMSWAG